MGVSGVPMSDQHPGAGAADSHAVEPSDEGRHPPGTELLWNESYYLDFVAEDGRIAGYARIGLYPNLGVTWWTTMLVGEGRPVVASVAYDLPVAGGTGLDHRCRRRGHARDRGRPPGVDEPPGHRTRSTARPSRGRLPGCDGNAHHHRHRSGLDHGRDALPLRPDHPLRGALSGAR